MGKGTTFVVLYSVILLTLFGIFCYLMSIVNPEPLKDPDGTTTTEIAKERPAANNSKYIEQQTKDDETVATRLRHDINSTPLERRNNVVNVVPPFWPALNPNPPIYNYVTETHTSGDYYTPSKYATADYNTATLATVKKNFSLISEISAPIKGFRRSVKKDDDYVEEIEKEEDSDFDSVILEIMDNKGQSRIEIKLGSIGFARRNNRSPGRKSNLNMLIKNNASTKLKKNRLYKNTVIKVMPDNSLIVNDDSQPFRYTITTNHHLENKSDATNESHNINFTNTAFQDIKNKTNTNSSIKAVSEIFKIKDVYNQSEDMNDLNTELKLKVLIDNKTETISNFGQFVNEDNFIPDNETSAINSFNLVTEVFTDTFVNLIEPFNITDNVPLFEPKDDKSNINNRFLSTRYPFTLEQIDFTEFNDSKKRYTVSTAVKLNVIETTLSIFATKGDVTEKLNGTESNGDNIIITATVPDILKGDNIVNDTDNSENNITNSSPSTGSIDVKIPISNNATADSIVTQLTPRTKVKSKQTVDVRDLNDVYGNITKILVKRFNS